MDKEIITDEMRNEMSNIFQTQTQQMLYEMMEYLDENFDHQSEEFGIRNIGGLMASVVYELAKKDERNVDDVLDQVISVYHDILSNIIEQLGNPNETIH